MSTATVNKDRQIGFVAPGELFDLFQKKADALGVKQSTALRMCMYAIIDMNRSELEDFAERAVESARHLGHA